MPKIQDQKLQIEAEIKHIQQKITSVYLNPNIHYDDKKNHLQPLREALDNLKEKQKNLPEEGKEKEPKLTPEAKNQLAKFEQILNSDNSDLIRIKTLSCVGSILEKTLQDYVDIDASVRVGTQKKTSTNKLSKLTAEEKKDISNSLSGLEKILFERLATKAGKYQTTTAEATARHIGNTIAGIGGLVPMITLNRYQIELDEARKALEMTFSVLEVNQIFKECQKNNQQAIQGLRGYMMEQETEIQRLKDLGVEEIKKDKDKKTESDKNQEEAKQQLEQERQEYQRISSELQAENQRLESSEQVAVRNLSEIRTEYETLQNQNLGLVEQNQAYHSKITELLALATHKEEKLSLSLKEQQRLLSAWKISNRTIDERNARLRALNAENSALSKEKALLFNDHERLKSDYQTLTQAAETLLSEKSDLETQLNQLKTEKDTLETKLQKEIQKKRLSQLGTIATEAVEWLPIPQKWQTGLKAGIQTVNGWAIIKDLPNWTYEASIGIFFISFWYVLLALIRKFHRLIFGKKAREKISNLEQALENLLIKNGNSQPEPEPPAPEAEAIGEPVKELEPLALIDKETELNQIKAQLAQLQAEKVQWEQTKIPPKKKTKKTQKKPPKKKKKITPAEL